MLVSTLDFVSLVEGEKRLDECDMTRRMSPGSSLVGLLDDLAAFTRIVVSSAVGS